MSMLLVSVIVPFLNVEEFLKETIESVVDQDYKNWQLILVDDGSTDNSTAIAKEYVQRYPDKILYFDHPGHQNKGVCATRNLGIKKAAGELVAFLDSDDVWKREKLSEQVALVLKYPESAMFCEASIYWKTWEQPEKEDRIVPVGIEPEKVYYPPHLALNLYPLKKKAAAPCPSSILIKKSVLEEIGGFEETFIGKFAFIEDQAFLFKVYLNTTVFVSSSCNNYYRLRKKSAMAIARKEREYKRNGKYFFLKWAKKYVKEQKIDRKDLDEALENSLQDYKYSFFLKVCKKVKSALTKVKILVASTG